MLPIHGNSIRTGTVRSGCVWHIIHYLRAPMKLPLFDVPQVKRLQVWPIQLDSGPLASMAVRRLWDVNSAIEMLDDRVLS